MKERWSELPIAINLGIIAMEVILFLFVPLPKIVSIRARFECHGGKRRKVHEREKSTRKCLSKRTSIISPIRMGILPPGMNAFLVKEQWSFVLCIKNSFNSLESAPLFKKSSPLWKSFQILLILFFQMDRLALMKTNETIGS